MEKYILVKNCTTCPIEFCDAYTQWEGKLDNMENMLKISPHCPLPDAPANIQQQVQDDLDF